MNIKTPFFYVKTSVKGDTEFCWQLGAGESGTQYPADYEPILTHYGEALHAFLQSYGSNRGEAEKTAPEAPASKPTKAKKK